MKRAFLLPPPPFARSCLGPPTPSTPAFPPVKIGLYECERRQEDKAPKKERRMKKKKRKKRRKKKIERKVSKIQNLEGKRGNKDDDAAASLSIMHKAKQRAPVGLLKDACMQQK
ncbi:hypothetical protein CEXT_667341 [Caerostris extrusa]|uniref:Uncharacterized protein n=1 Tax=Caerostris extrusa TaxID=172846 RepID=A0AAV4UWQ1_CAEEX|nr:hypothetical protein CEXT_667341 [Caerostris extrusa]